MAKIICIGVGHGGRDSGAINGSRRESDDNLNLALSVAKLLREQGHTAIPTRTDNRDSTPEQRRQIAIDAGANLFIDLHRNSFANATAKGIEIWIRNEVYRQAAGEVLEALSGTPNQGIRGLFVGAYRVLYDMPMPAMLLELGFISNARDNELFDTHLDTYALAIVKGILAALGEPYKEPGATLDNLYRVQVGAFRSKENADNFLQTVRDMGLPAFLVAPGVVGEVE